MTEETKQKLRDKARKRISTPEGRAQLLFASQKSAALRRGKSKQDKNLSYKTCSQCKETKNKIEFYTDITHYDGYASRCKKCFSETCKTNTEFVRTLKIKCCLCGYNNSLALIFHHLDYNDKDYGISTLRNCKKERIIEEASKCVVLCSNCHETWHAIYGNRNFPNFNDTIDEMKKLLNL